jgi:hypothetical protein
MAVTNKRSGKRKEGYVMFDTGVERTIIGTAVVLWFAHGWYLNDRLARVHGKLDRILEQFDGLRNYLYEIDPQFDDERELLRELDRSVEGGTSSFAGMNHADLVQRKERDGRRTLTSPFVASDQ